jgi:hypothetical protein
MCALITREPWAQSARVSSNLSGPARYVDQSDPFCSMMRSKVAILNCLAIQRQIFANASTMSSMVRSPYADKIAPSEATCQRYPYSLTLRKSYIAEIFPSRMFRQRRPQKAIAFGSCWRLRCWVGHLAPCT